MVLDLDSPGNTFFDNEITKALPVIRAHVVNFMKKKYGPIGTIWWDESLKLVSSTDRKNLIKKANNTVYEDCFDYAQCLKILLNGIDKNNFLQDPNFNQSITHQLVDSLLKDRNEILGHKNVNTPDNIIKQATNSLISFVSIIDNTLANAIQSDFNGYLQTKSVKVQSYMMVTQDELENFAHTQIKMMTEADMDRLISEPIDDLDSLKKEVELGIRKQFKLGLSYLLGDKQPKSISDALKYFKGSAIVGYVDSQLILGHLYATGKEVSQSWADAVEWYEMAVENDSAIAQTCLGSCYANGTGVTQSFEKAVKYYKLAEEHGDTTAMNNLANCYYNGCGVIKSEENAIDLLKKSASLGNTDANFMLGLIYSNRGEYENAINYYKEAADKDNMRAQANLAYCYYKGFGVTKSYKEAARLFEITANKGSIESQYDLALMYMKGEGVEQSYSISLEWFKKAAERGHDSAQYMVGYYYYYGLGVSRSITEAKIWFSKAAANGNENAKKVIEDLLKS